jgi:hypothetical protein
VSQIPTRPTTVEAIMADPEFQLGVNDVRANLPPQFDAHAAHWEYERGRQWGAAAPPDLPLKINGRINPRAVAVYRKAEII